ncbi:uncharacterized protein JN550_006531 [Neoarthrinium moseri]|uniref:uncharacterized protein n=1 Tax=Neoarthrinium moseri TaxID=1658444 RepID=UPI001FDAE358|nr:uncharacterized protein JN550_006531 [Neoarthrinium moseri]KAI1868043.1 hypothetical protein JN550_006531 [Neoarthrinium moseri]
MHVGSYETQVHIRAYSFGFGPPWLSYYTQRRPRNIAIDPNTMHPVKAVFVCAGLPSIYAAVHVKKDQEFHIPNIYAHQPSGRPGNSPYCTVSFDIIDVATQTNTSCFVEHGPCVSNSKEPKKPLPTKDNPQSCDNTDFSFYLPEYQYIGNYTVHVEHCFLKGCTNLMHEATSKVINKANYPAGYHYTCGGSGVCNAYYSSITDPIALPFQKDCNQD